MQPPPPPKFSICKTKIMYPSLNSVSPLLPASINYISPSCLGHESEGILYPSLCVLTCVEGACTYTRIWRLEINAVVILYCYLRFWNRVSQCDWSSTIQLDRLDREPQGPSCLCIPNAGVKGVCPGPASYMDTGHWTQVITLIQQVLYWLSYLPSLSYLYFCEWLILPGMSELLSLHYWWSIAYVYAFLSPSIFTHTWSASVIDTVDNTALHLGVETMVETLALSSSGGQKYKCQILWCFHVHKACLLLLDISQKVLVFKLTYFYFSNAWTKKNQNSFLFFTTSTPFAMLLSVDNILGSQVERHKLVV